MPSKFVGDDEEAKAYTIIKAADREEQDEDEFLEWSDEMDAADAEKERQDSLVTIASHGIDITASPDDGPPLLDRSLHYLQAYKEAKYDTGEWRRDASPEEKEFLEWAAEAEAEEDEFLAWAAEQRSDGFNPDQERDEDGKFGAGGGSSSGGSKKEEKSGSKKEEKSSSSKGGSARDHAKSLVTKAKEIREKAKKDPTPENIAAAKAADRASKAARAAARKEEAKSGAPKKAESSKNLGQAGTKTETAKREAAAQKAAAKAKTPAEKMAAEAMAQAAASSKAKEGKSEASSTAKSSPAQVAAMSQQATNESSLAYKKNSEISHSNAQLAHQAAAEMHAEAGDKQKAGWHQRQAEDHQKRVAQLKAKGAKLSDTSGTLVHRKQVDDYEHSGDTEGEVDELESLGAVSVSGQDSDGEDGPEGHVTYKLPKGVSHQNFNKVREASHHVQGHNNPNAAAKASFEKAKASVKAGKGEEAQKHAEDVIAHANK